jgi:hypothetical protein
MGNFRFLMDTGWDMKGKKWKLGITDEDATRAIE